MLLDGRLELTNNLAERTVKPFVMARKNFLFSDTAKGADASALCFSVIETAKYNGLDPFGYLLFLLQELPKLGENPPSRVLQTQIILTDLSSLWELFSLSLTGDYGALTLSFSSWEGNILLILVEGRKKHRNPLICLLWRSCALHQILLPSELKLFGARDNKLIEPRGNNIIMNESFLLCRQLHHIKNDRCLIPVFLQECAFDDFCRMS